MYWLNEMGNESKGAEPQENSGERHWYGLGVQLMAYDMSRMIVPAVFLGGGLLMRALALFPNCVIGYKSKRAASSPEMWNYAQKISSRYFIVIGIVEMAIVLIMWLTQFEISKGVLNNLFVIPGGLSIFLTEYRLIQRERQKVKKEIAS